MFLFAIQYGESISIPNLPIVQVQLKRPGDSSPLSPNNNPARTRFNDEVDGPLNPVEDEQPGKKNNLSTCIVAMHNHMNRVRAMRHELDGALWD